MEQGQPPGLSQEQLMEQIQNLSELQNKGVLQSADPALQASLPLSPASCLFCLPQYIIKQNASYFLPHH